MSWQAWIPAAAMLQAAETQRDCTCDEANDQIKAVVINTDIHITSMGRLQVWEDTVSVGMVGREIWAVN